MVMMKFYIVYTSAQQVEPTNKNTPITLLSYDVVTAACYIIPLIV